MNAYDIILKKRRGFSLSGDEIRFFIDGYTKGDIPDYQAAALMMAICFTDMTDEETAIMTDAMARSGQTADLSAFGSLSVDKHSTGGVGDKTTLILAPVVASLGAKIAKMSGRGLGHTGGTVDKLESIPGYRSDLDPETFIQQVEKIGIAVIGQSEMFTPADKKLYALRDVTATVDSIPLIASSIMSKKIAAGAGSIVLDVKVGAGAFMKNEQQGQALARKMVEIGKRHGKKTAALITNMDIPLGTAIGNSLEMIEAIEILKGKKKGSAYELSVALAAQLISFASGITVEDARKKAVDAIDDGKAFYKMKEWIKAQGGDIRFLEDTSLFPTAKYCMEIRASKSGCLSRIDAGKIGAACVSLGAGRIKKGDDIDHTAGVLLDKTIGDRVREGDTLCRLFWNRNNQIDTLITCIKSAFEISDQPPETKSLIYKVIR